MFEQYKLHNNATVILIPLQDTKSLTTLIMYPVGSRYEPEKISGVSHYIEHLMFKGTKIRKNTLALTREIDRLGAEYNAFTGKEYTGYYIKTDAKFSQISLDILADMLFNSTFDPKEMEREKGPIIEELRMYRDNPVMNIDNIFEELMFQGCALGRDIGGTVEHVKNFQRDEVLAYKHKYYQAGNMTIVLAGAIPDDMKTLIDTYFGIGEKVKGLSTKYAPAKFGSAKKSERIVVEKKPVDQAQLMLGFPAFSYGDKRNAAGAVMNTILGGSMSSRLFIQIRERRGLAYSVSSGSDNFRDIGYAYVRAGLEPKNINTAIRVIKGEIEKLIVKGVTTRELNDAKTHIRGALTLTMEDSSAQANWYAKHALFYDRLKTPEERLVEIEAVTKEDVQSVAKQIFRMTEMRVAIIGDVEKSEVSF